MRQDRRGGVRARWTCAECEALCVDTSGWRVMFGVGTEPAVVCSAACAAVVRADNRRQTWLEQPLQTLLVDLAVRYGSPRRSARCRLCRSSQRPEIDRLLIEQTMTQRQVAAQYGYAKGSVATHAIAHLPVMAMLAAGRG